MVGTTCRALISLMTLPAPSKPPPRSLPSQLTRLSPVKLLDLEQARDGMVGTTCRALISHMTLPAPSKPPPRSLPSQLTRLSPVKLLDLERDFKLLLDLLERVDDGLRAAAIEHLPRRQPRLPYVVFEG